MSDFEVHTFTTAAAAPKRAELIKQIESLQRFYFDLGYDTDNIKTIFSLTLSFLKGRVNKLIVKSFFEVLMLEDKLNCSKEINLLNCFEDLVDNLNTEDSSDLLGFEAKAKASIEQLNLKLKAA